MRAAGEEVDRSFRPIASPRVVEGGALIVFARISERDPGGAARGDPPLLRRRYEAAGEMPVRGPETRPVESRLCLAAHLALPGSTKCRMNAEAGDPAGQCRHACAQC